MWQGQAPHRPFNQYLFSHWSDQVGHWWGNWQDFSNDMLTGMGSHSYDMVQYVLGMDELGPVELWPVKRDLMPAFTSATPTASKCVCASRTNGRIEGPAWGAIFVDDKCKIEINRNKFTTNPPDFIQNPPDPALAEKWEGDGWIAKGHVQNWFDCIKTRTRPNADVETGHRSATVCHLLDITKQLERRLRWNPEIEEFVADDEANRLIDRPRRKGWELPNLG